MIKKIILFKMLLLIAITSLTQQIYRPTLKEKDFLNWVISKDKIHILVGEPLLLDTTLLSKIFDAIAVSRKDSLNIVKKAKKINSINFKTWQLTGTKIIDKSTIPQLNKEPYGPPEYYRISPPLFFKKGQQVAIVIENFCGNLCGSGILIIYKIKNGKYEIEHLDKLWTS